MSDNACSILSTTGTSARGLSEVPSVGRYTSAKRSRSSRSSGVSVTEPLGTAASVARRKNQETGTRQDAELRERSSIELVRHASPSEGLYHSSDSDSDSDSASASGLLGGFLVALVQSSIDQLLRRVCHLLVERRDDLLVVCGFGAVG